MATTEAQRIAGAAAVLKREKSVSDVAKKYNVLPATVYAWKKKYPLGTLSSEQQRGRKRAPGGGRRGKTSVVRDLACRAYAMLLEEHGSATGAMLLRRCREIEGFSQEFKSPGSARSWAHRLRLKVKATPTYKALEAENLALKAKLDEAEFKNVVRALINSVDGLIGDLAVRSLGVTGTSRPTMINGIVNFVQSFDSTEATEKMKAELVKFRLYRNELSHDSDGSAWNQDLKAVKETSVWLERELNKLEWRAWILRNTEKKHAKRIGGVENTVNAVQNGEATSDGRLGRH